ncbi:hypothetical protein AWC38_SpisGene19823 [Stylophora pistillata]|uniref:Uncharacterized protein n=1 Tax=Stylophora pistillata TaxID=50429 RepID=A0A2B4RI54_STYPI|nr:hypothetical protein AWC38_SpisGene19823 [Stylophora pistillata]
MAETQKEYMKEFYVTAENLEKRMSKDVLKVCEVLKLVQKQCNERESGSLPDNLKNLLRMHFRDIFWSLKLHLLFHGATDDALRKIGEWELVSLTANEMEAAPDATNVIDPGSKILEILSEITHREDAPKGSSEHAKEVMTKAKSFFESLPKVFRPKALAVVSHDKSFVGASIAVSSFLRPLYLHKRIADFTNPRLREAVILHKLLQTEDKQNWSSKATDTKGNRKPPCTNCQNTFECLQGFVLETEQGVGSNRTFLGAYAEFCPVDKLLQGETNACNSEDVERRLESNLEQCLTLFREFDTIKRECKEAFTSGDTQRIREVYTQIRPKVHIFGRKPECNDKFGSDTID